MYSKFQPKSFKYNYLNQFKKPDCEGILRRKGQETNYVF